MKPVLKCLRKVVCLFIFISINNVRGNDSISALLLSIKETHIYAIKDSNILRFDKYALKQQRAKQPCVFFLFGGSFRGGRRDNPAYFKYFEALVRRGYVVFSIDYRLGLRNVNTFDGDGSALEKAIKMSEEDLFDATAFALEHANDWNIDPDAVVISGSSAGALSVLSAVYDAHNKAVPSNKLPPDFSYAGAIAFAGAIFCKDQSALVLKNDKMCPLMMFHGDRDRVVPFEHFKLGNSGIFGPKCISEKLDSLNSPYWLYTVEKGGHEVANTPMNENHLEIFKFLDDLVLNKKRIRMRTSCFRLNSEKNEAKPVLADFIKNNFLAR